MCCIPFQPLLVTGNDFCYFFFCSEFWISSDCISFSCFAYVGNSCYVVWFFVSSNFLCIMNWIWCWNYILMYININQYIMFFIDCFKILFQILGWGLCMGNMELLQSSTAVLTFTSVNCCELLHVTCYGEVVDLFLSPLACSSLFSIISFNLFK